MSLVNLYKKIKKTEHKKMNLDKIKYNTTDGIKIQSKLNKFTIANFKENSEEYKSLIYKNIENLEGKINYADWDVQKIINEYNNNLYDVIENKKTNNIFVQIKNAANLLIKDRTRLKNSIQYKFNQIFKKKD